MVERFVYYPTKSIIYDDFVILLKKRWALNPFIIPLGDEDGRRGRIQLRGPFSPAGRRTLRLYAKGVYVKEGSHPYRMSKFKQPSQQVIDASRSNMQFIETIRFLKNE